MWLYYHIGKAHGNRVCAAKSKNFRFMSWKTIPVTSPKNIFSPPSVMHVIQYKNLILCYTSSYVDNVIKMFLLVLTIPFN